jgi:hypothetical protein
MVLPEVSTTNNRDLIIALAARHRPEPRLTRGWRSGGRGLCGLLLLASGGRGLCGPDEDE